MILQVFSIYDSATKAFHQPWYMLTVEEAQRTFKNLANDPESNICKNPTDYSLYHLGQFDNLSAKINTTDLQLLGLANEYVEGMSADNVVKMEESA